MSEPKKLAVNGLKGASYAGAEYRVTPKTNETIEDITTPLYWANVASILKTYDEVTAIWEDGSKMAKLLVLSTAPLSATMFVLSMHNLREDRKKAVVEPKKETVAEVKKEESVNVGLDVVHRGTIKKWCVVRKQDKAMLKEGFDLKTDAEDWAFNNSSKTL